MADRVKGDIVIKLIEADKGKAIVQIQVAGNGRTLASWPVMTMDKDRHTITVHVGLTIEGGISPEAAIEVE